MIKIGVRLANGEKRVEEFPNLGGRSSVEKGIMHPRKSDAYFLQSFVGEHTHAYSTATRLAGNMRHGSKVYGDKISDREWAGINQHVTRNKPLALEEKRFITFLKWIMEEIDRGHIKALKYQITPGVGVTRSREMYSEGVNMTREELIEAILETAYPGDADIGKYIHMAHLDKGGGYRHMSRAQHKAQRSMWRTQKNASIHLRDSGFDPARFAGKHNQELQVSIEHLKKNKIRGKDRMIKPTIPQDIW